MTFLCHHVKGIWNTISYEIHIHRDCLYGVQNTVRLNLSLLQVVMFEAI